MSAQELTVLDAPELDLSKPHVTVRDRTRGNVEFQQGQFYYDKSGRAVAVAEVSLFFEERPPPPVTVRDISTRRIGRSKSFTQPGVPEDVKGDPLPASKRGAKAGVRNGLPESVIKAHQENARAAAAEKLA